MTLNGCASLPWSIMSVRRPPPCTSILARVCSLESTQYRRWFNRSEHSGRKRNRSKHIRQKHPRPSYQGTQDYMRKRFLPSVIPLGQTMLSDTKVLRSTPFRPPFSILAGVPQSVQYTKLDIITNVRKDISQHS